MDVDQTRTGVKPLRVDLLRACRRIDVLAAVGDLVSVADHRAVSDVMIRQHERGVLNADHMDEPFLSLFAPPRARAGGRVCSFSGKIARFTPVGRSVCEICTKNHTSSFRIHLQAVFLPFCRKIDVIRADPQKPRGSLGRSYSSRALPRSRRARACSARAHRCPRCRCCAAP